MMLLLFLFFATRIPTLTMKKRLMRRFPGGLQKVRAIEYTHIDVHLIGIHVIQTMNDGSCRTSCPHADPDG